jgi:hypothetical protein
VTQVTQRRTEGCLTGPGSAKEPEEGKHLNFLQTQSFLCAKLPRGRVSRTARCGHPEAAAVPPAVRHYALRRRLYPLAELGKRIGGIDIDQDAIAIHLDLDDKVGVLFDKPPRTGIA